MAHGGYRKPTNPAPVSGPGQHSRRTDGQPTMDLPNAKYGENSDFRSIEAGAAIPNDQASAPSAASAAPASSGPPALVGMGAPSQQPGVPVTAGAALGDGPGPEALGIRGSNSNAEALRQYLPTLIDIAQRDDTLPGTRQWVRSIIASLG